MGASVTVLNIAFATFTQQLVSLETLAIANGTPKSFARCRQYYQSTTVDSSTRGAIIAASFKGNDASPLTPQCPTGNCTFPHSIPTMAICGGCTDVAAQLDNQATCDWSLPDDKLETVGKPCIYNLPNGHSLEFLPANSVDARPGPFAVSTPDELSWGHLSGLIATGVLADTCRSGTQSISQAVLPSPAITVPNNQTHHLSPTTNHRLSMQRSSRLLESLRMSQSPYFTVATQPMGHYRNCMPMSVLCGGVCN